MKHKNLVIEAAVYTFTSYLVMPFTIVGTLLVRRTLGPYLAGVVATLTLFVHYASFSNLGILSAAEIELPYCKGSGELQRFEQIRRSAFAFTIAATFLFSLGTMLWAVVSRSTLDEPLFIGLLVYVLYILVQQWVYYYITLLRTAKEFIFLGKNQALFGLLSSIGNVVGVMIFGFVGLLAATVIVIFLQAVWLTRHTGYLPPLQVNWHEIKRLVVIGVPVLVLGMAFTGIKTVDNILVARLLGTEALGLYTVALMANTLVFSVTNALGGVLFPRMQEAYGRQRTAETLGVYIIRPTLIMSLLLPIGIGAVFLGLPVVVHWLLPRFVPGLPACKVIALGTYFLAMLNLTGSALSSLHKQLKYALIVAGALGVTVGLALVFVGWGWGMVGIALATVLGYVACFVSISAYALLHWTAWRQVASFLGNLVLPFVYSAALLLLLDQVRPAWADGLVASFGLVIVKILVFVLAYTPLIVLMERQTQLIADFVRPVASRLWRQVAAL